MNDFIVQYNLEPVELNVLLPRQTMCEKTVSLIRFSMSDTPLASFLKILNSLHNIDLKNSKE